MGDKSGIEWTDATWNPTTGCDRVSPGCANCYAVPQAKRNQAMANAAAQAKGMRPLPTAPYMRDGDPKTSGPGFGLMVHDDRLDVPLRWTRPRRIFVNSMSDLFHPEVPDEFIDKVFAVMALADWHTFQILTKRPDRMRAYVSTQFTDGYHEPPDERADRVAFEMGHDRWRKFEHKGEMARSGIVPWPLPNVWLGTSVENARWRTRIDELRETPAAVRFLSCEPLLGPLVPNPLGEGLDDLNLDGIDWVIVGGESGPRARAMELDWVRDIVGACRQQGAAPFVKQLGDAWSREHLGHPGHGGDIETFPEDLRIREYPRQAVPA